MRDDQITGLVTGPSPLWVVMANFEETPPLQGGFKRPFFTPLSFLCLHHSNYFFPPFFHLASPYLFPSRYLVFCNYLGEDCLGIAASLSGAVMASQIPVGLVLQVHYILSLCTSLALYRRSLIPSLMRFRAYKLLLWDCFYVARLRLPLSGLNSSLRQAKRFGLQARPLILMGNLRPRLRYYRH